MVRLMKVYMKGLPFQVKEKKLVELLKHSTLRWLRHLEKMVQSEMTTYLYKSRIDIVGELGQIKVNWEDNFFVFEEE